ncbi:M20 family metallopeptidase [Nocardia puris]|uniref:Acetylornithine deacetylase n=1 Tax=Nocardia puris TaxID=208602 RepID=A0A366DN42_9NOCA|nr:M20/M25/M40 family metallo-hydrolase [Nocardia puris]MBF6211295.1 M20 family metallopeptidase [Nocardia puris]MBF6365014.1 M20 family metallopeptidase [Nocardia puris]MBF6458799.1 M20 family metallopeptidase [Nocardia puris]RBO90648.1 acetylornithine deacetylase [Nocardia puris]
MNDATARVISARADLMPDDELIALAAALTAVPSFTGEETALAEVVRDILRRNDIPAWLDEVTPGRHQTIGLLGPETGTPALLFNGHLDMDPLGRNHPADPFVARLDGDQLYGAGLHNMKSGLAAILGAAIMVRRSGLPLRRGLLLEFVVGELQGGVGTRHALAAGLAAEAAVVPEPYSVRRVITRTAGVHKFALVARGRTAHTSRHHEGVDAIAVLRAVLDRLDTADLGLRNPDFPPLPRLQIASLLAGRGEGHDVAGVSYCADKATALIDLRYPPPFEPADVTAALDAFLTGLRPAFPDADLALEHPVDPAHRVGGTDMPPMDVPPDSPLVHDIAALLPRVSDFTVSETGLALPYSFCGNDTTHLTRAGIESCLFGPRGDGPDTEHHVLFSEMRACADTLAALAVQRCG